MKSLEHLIRLVHEGKAEKGEKSSLEHAIRKIRETKLDDIESTKATRAGRFDTKMTESDLNYMGSGTGGEPKMHAEDGKKKKTYESIGVGGSDDPVGNQFKSIRTATPHIKPPAGPGSHSQAPENAARQRTLAKERISMTMHGKVNEENKKPKKYDGSGDDKETKPEAPDQDQSIIEKGRKYLQKNLKDDPTFRAAQELGHNLPGYENAKAAREKFSQGDYAGAAKETALNLGKAALAGAAVSGVTRLGVAALRGAPGLAGLVAGSLLGGGRSGYYDREDDKKTAYDRTVRAKASSARKHRRFAEETERRQIENVPRKGERRSIDYVGRKDDDPKTSKEKTSRQAATRIKLNVVDESRKLSGIVLSTVKDKKQQIKARTEDGLGQSSKNIQYPNGTVVSINPELSRTTMDIDGKMPNDYK